MSAQFGATTRVRPYGYLIISLNNKLSASHLYSNFMNLRVIWSYWLYTWGGLHRYFGNQNSIVREYERAVHYFKRSYEVNPHFTYARLQRAIILGRELCRYEESLAEFDAYLQTEPDDGRALLNKGLVLQEHGRFPEALACIQQYLNLPEPDEHYKEARRIAGYLQEIIDETAVDNSG